MTQGLLSSAKDWDWWVHQDSITYAEEVYAARDYFTEHVIPAMIQGNQPHEFVYDPVAETINFVCIAQSMPPGVVQILKDAQFFLKPIPEHDWQGEQELKAAVLGGSDFNKTQH